MKQLLRDADALTDEELEQAKIDFELKRTELVELEEEIARSQLVAPFDGTIVSIDMSPGDKIEAYQTVAVIADMSQLTVAVSINKDNLEEIAVGMEAEVDINAHGSHSGKVARLPAVEEEEDRGYYYYDSRGSADLDTIDKYLVIELDDFPEEVTRATPLSAAIVTERKEDAIVIPPSVLRTYGGRTYVQVVEEDGTKREVDVEVGMKTSTQVEIVKGLEPGMKVVGN